MAAEVLGVPVEDIIVYSSDTDFTPFDKGAYASSTTYISGTAVAKAAQQVAERIKLRATWIFQERGLQVKPEEIILADRKAVSPDGNFVTLEEIGHSFAPPGQPGTDHGGCLSYVPIFTASVCCSIC